MEELKFRDLRADEIELRIGSTKRKNASKPKSDENPVVGFQLLLYKNARVDANILDETVGQFNWTKEYYQVKNTMFCRVGIRNPQTNEWIYKSDAGDDDFQTEQVKGEASDSFKRACFAWGLGRLNLYYGPFIWIKCNNDINEYSKLYVSEIEYVDSIISKMTIRERNTEKLVFSYKTNQKVIQEVENATNNLQELPKEELQELKGSIEPNDLKTIQELVSAFTSETSRKNFYAWLDKYFQTMNVETLTKTQGKKVLDRLINGR